MFEMLAVLHLNELASSGQGSETNPQVERVLSELQQMPKEERQEFLRFAVLQRAYLRTLQLLEKSFVADGGAPRFDGLEEMRRAEQGQNDIALMTLSKIVQSLE